LVVVAPTVLIVVLLKLPSVYNLGWIQMGSSIGFSVLGCIISVILVLALLPVFEFAFNRLTVFRLCELTSTNAPILKRLQREAPGTFNHSLIVAQLSETCAVAIGENAELARAAAYYHDVGKLKQPDCFTENQTGYNVHDELMPELSADIIRSHAKDGYDLITSSRLPAVIADVAREHHGTLPIKYFYNKAMRLSGGDADVKDYSYLGPIPQTKIAAIVMIADAAEAATRALQTRVPENVERAVRSIIEERMDLGQFDECNITMRELTTIKLTLVDALSGVHHSRISYPAIRFNSDRKAVKEDPIEDEKK
ncbi:MAG: HD domain-containing protein, partial [Clostridia bacterium]|nr:HD domain-containing protein [Clostridia bacterium]